MALRWAGLSRLEKAYPPPAPPNPLLRYQKDPLGYIRNVLRVRLWSAQEEIVRAGMRKPHKVAVKACHGVGKAQPVDTWMDTPDGRRRFGDLQPGDFVFGKDGHPTRVIGVYPQGVRPQFRVTLDDGSSTLADAEHLWTVRGRNGRLRGGEWEVLTTAEIVARGVVTPNGKAVFRQWELPDCQPVQYPSHAVPVPAYTMGVWLGDGTVGVPRVTTADSDMTGWLSNDNNVQVICYPLRGKTSSLFVPGLRAGLTKAGVFKTPTHQKRVPRAYLENDVATRLAVLQGLLDTDGTVGKTNHCVTFCSTSVGLVEDVVWLVRSLGGKARKQGVKSAWYRKSDGTRIQGRPAYQASLSLPGMRLFRLDRKQVLVRLHDRCSMARRIASIEPEGEAVMHCIRVEAADQLYLTNDFIVTHNSFLLACLICWHYDCFEHSLTITTAPSKEAVEDQLWREVRGLRTRVGLAGFAGKKAPELWSAEDHWAKGITTDSPEALHGRHAQNMLFIIDEAVGVEAWVYDVFSSMFKPDSEHLQFIIGNPTDTASQMYAEELKTQLDGSPAWTWITMSALDHPNLQAELRGQPAPYPSAVSLAQFEMWLADWAEPLPADQATALDLQWPPGSSQWYRPGPLMESRGLGRWPSQATFGVFSDAAWNATLLRQDEPWDTALLPEVGCDGARHGDDYSAIAARLGPCLLYLERHNGWDVLQIVQRLKELCGELAARATRARPPQAAPILATDIPVKIDGDTGGQDIVTLRGEYRFLAVCASSSPLSPGDYPNRRSELWFAVAKLARAGQLDFTRLPPAVLARLRQQAMGPTWKPDAAGRQVLEKKEETKKRLRRGSPDEMDAVLLAFSVAGTPGIPVAVSTPRRGLGPPLPVPGVETTATARADSDEPRRKLFGRA